MNRRTFLQTASLGTAAAAGPALAAAALSPSDAKRPNIILIMADDMGYSDLGCFGSEIHTPNLDRLATGGMRLTQFYNTARCCPTRASLLTGLYPHQAGIGHMVNPRPIPAYQGYLNDRCSTLAEVLRGAGYKTLMSGKWHVGENRPHWPVDRGFDHYFGLISGADNYWKLDPGRKMAIDDKPYTPPAKGFYMTDAIADHAAGFIDQHGRGEQPFFLYAAFTAPHWPLHAYPEDIAKYQGKYEKGWDALRQERHKRMIEMDIVDKKWPLTERDSTAPAWESVKDKKALDLAMAVYAAQIDRLDQGIGKILDKLREVGAEENTLVMFLSDNGGCAEVVNQGKKGVPPGPVDSYLSYGLAWANASNTPFRLYKHWVHEGGISTPFIAHWPKVIKKTNSFSREVGHLVDVMATCVDISGAKYPGAPIQPMEGKSLLPVFQGKKRPERTLFWEHEGNRAVRRGKWKLVSRNPGKWELYDVEADRTEFKDLAAKMPAKVADFDQQYTAWASRCGVLPFDTLPKAGPLSE
ncbi:MAG: arylsulfatase [Acidobacteriota bacterium]